MVGVRDFQSEDAQALADLLAEMASFYGAAIDPGLTVTKDVIRQSEQVDIIVAHDGARLLGFATFTLLYPVRGLIPFIYAQQIYVAQSARRLGVARELMAGIARAAKAAGITRIEWSTSKENTAARSFYEGLGADGSEKIYYELDGAALDRLASRSTTST